MQNHTYRQIFEINNVTNNTLNRPEYLPTLKKYEEYVQNLNTPLADLKYSLKRREELLRALSTDYLNLMKIQDYPQPKFNTNFLAEGAAIWSMVFMNSGKENMNASDTSKNFVFDATGLLKNTRLEESTDKDPEKILVLECVFASLGNPDNKFLEETVKTNPHPLVQLARAELYMNTCYSERISKNKDGYLSIQNECLQHVQVYKSLRAALKRSKGCTLLKVPTRLLYGRFLCNDYLNVWKHKKFKLGGKLNTEKDVIISAVKQFEKAGVYHRYGLYAAGKEIISSPLYFENRVKISPDAMELLRKIKLLAGDHKVVKKMEKLFLMVAIHFYGLESIARAADLGEEEAITEMKILLNQKSRKDGWYNIVMKLSFDVMQQLSNMPLLDLEEKGTEIKANQEKLQKAFLKRLKKIKSRNDQSLKKVLQNEKKLAKYIFGITNVKSLLHNFKRNCILFGVQIKAALSHVSPLRLKFRDGYRLPEIEVLPLSNPFSVDQKAEECLALYEETTTTFLVALSHGLNQLFGNGCSVSKLKSIFKTYTQNREVVSHFLDISVEEFIFCLVAQEYDWVPDVVFVAVSVHYSVRIELYSGTDTAPKIKGKNDPSFTKAVKLVYNKEACSYHLRDLNSSRQSQRQPPDLN